MCCVILIEMIIAEMVEEEDDEVVLVEEKDNTTNDDDVQVMYEKPKVVPLASYDPQAQVLQISNPVKYISECHNRIAQLSKLETFLCLPVDQLIISNMLLQLVKRKK